MKLSVANLVFSLITLSLTPLTAVAFDEMRSYEAGQWDLETQFNYFNATANYSSAGGEYNSLSDGHKYSTMDLDLGARWTPTSRLGIFAQGRYSYATSQDLLSTRNNGGISHLVLGADYYLAKYNLFSLIPEFTFLYPFERISTTADTVLFSEGAMETTARLIVRGNPGTFTPFGFIGVTYRDEGRSNLLPYGAGLEFSFSSLMLGGEIRGYQSITDDDKTSFRALKEIVSNRNGGSLKYYSVNPALTEANFWLKFRALEDVQVKLGGGTTINGESSAAGWNVLASLTYSIAGSAYRSEPIKAESNTEFKEDVNDGVDQNIFRLPPPPPKPKPKPTPSPAAVRKKMQNELDQTEMSIELRSNKKKRKGR